MKLEIYHSGPEPLICEFSCKIILIVAPIFFLPVSCYSVSERVCEFVCECVYVYIYVCNALLSLLLPFPLHRHAALYL